MGDREGIGDRMYVRGSNVGGEGVRSGPGGRGVRD